MHVCVSMCVGGVLGSERGVMWVCEFDCYLQERGELLRKFVASGENLKACELQIRSSRRSTAEGERRMELVAVKDMSLPPYRFSPPLALQVDEFS